MSAARAIESLFRRYYWDPVAFCNDFFPPNERPREWQPEVLAAVERSPWIAIAACRKAGKTRLAAFLCIWFLCTRANSLVLTIAPVWDQVIQSIWADIRHLWAVSTLPRVFPNWQVLTHEIHTHPLTPKWRAIGVASDKAENLEGRHPAAGQPALIICDESKGILDDFFSSLQGMLSEGGMLVAIGTPGVPQGWFYRAHTKDRALWGVHKKIRADEIPRLAAKCEEERQRLGENDPFFRQQWLAEFTGADDGSVIPYQYVERAIGRKFAIAPTWKRVVSLDVADGGSDENVCTFRYGPVVLRQKHWQGVDPMQTAMRVAKEAVEFKAHIVVVDENGVGAGVRSRLRELLQPAGIPVFGFNGGRKAKDSERYANVKAEEVFMLRERFIRDETSIPNSPQLIGELTSWTAQFTATGKTKIVDPADSPDFADSCMMSFAADRLGQSVRGVTPTFLQ
jgi:phage terminase large subunit